jgi:hypothetical protein
MPEPKYNTEPVIPGPWQASSRDGTLKIRGPATAAMYKQREVCRIYGANRATVDLIVAAPDLCDALRSSLRVLERVAPLLTGADAAAIAVEIEVAKTAIHRADAGESRGPKPAAATPD